MLAVLGSKLFHIAVRPFHIKEVLPFVLGKDRHPFPVRRELKKRQLLVLPNLAIWCFDSQATVLLSHELVSAEFAKVYDGDLVWGAGAVHRVS